ncbi:MAG: hypothetical protein DCC49_01185 [Acidobacteria bacterium]|nr:MAG: hypothetical protein DCC49_01185 [Acidobacteriota bacterium]
MRGGVFQRNKTWTYYFDGPPRDDGKRRQISKGGFRTKKEAQDALRRAIGEVETTGRVPDRRITVGEFLDRWFESESPSMSPATRSFDELAIRVHLKPLFGGVRLSSLSTEAIQRAWNDYGASPASIRKFHGTLRRALGRAEDWGMISRSPATGVRLPHHVPPEPIQMNEETIGKVLEAVRSKAIWVPIALIATTGIRRGEALGLRWSDVDLDRQRISISQTYGKHGFGTPKTQRSRRQIRIGDLTTKVLSAEYERQLGEARFLSTDGGPWNPHNLVCPTAEGRPRDPDTFSRMFKDAISQAGLPPITVHELRHAHASMLLRDGVDLKVISERLGHSSVAITGDVYAHVVGDMQDSAAAASDEWLRSAL